MFYTWLLKDRCLCYTYLSKRARAAMLDRVQPSNTFSSIHYFHLFVCSDHGHPTPGSGNTKLQHDWLDRQPFNKRTQCVQLAHIVAIQMSVAFFLAVIIVWIGALRTRLGVSEVSTAVAWWQIKQMANYVNVLSALIIADRLSGGKLKRPCDVAAPGSLVGRSYHIRWLFCKLCSVCPSFKFTAHTT